MVKKVQKNKLFWIMLFIILLVIIIITIIIIKKKKGSSSKSNNKPDPDPDPDKPKPTPSGKVSYYSVDWHNRNNFNTLFFQNFINVSKPINWNNNFDHPYNNMFSKNTKDMLQSQYNKSQYINAGSNNLILSTPDNLLFGRTQNKNRNWTKPRLTLLNYSGKCKPSGVGEQPLIIDIVKSNGDLVSESDPPQTIQDGDNVIIIGFDGYGQNGALGEMCEREDIPCFTETNLEPNQRLRMSTFTIEIPSSAEDIEKYYRNRYNFPSDKKFLRHDRIFKLRHTMHDTGEIKYLSFNQNDDKNVQIVCGLNGKLVDYVPFIRFIDDGNNSSCLFKFQ